MKKQKLYLTIGIIAIILIGIFMYAQPKLISNVNTQESNTKLYSCNWLCNLLDLKQEAYFLTGGSYPSHFHIGDTVSTKEELLISNEACLTRGPLVSVKDIIMFQGVPVKTIDVYYKAPLMGPEQCPAGYTLIKTTTFVPYDNVGTYTIQSQVTRKYDTSPVNIPCTGTTTQCNLIVEARASTDVCTLTPRWGNWIQVTIPNGKQSTRTYSEVTGSGSSCTLQTTSITQTRIDYCNSGYISDGTSCVINDNPIVEPPVTETCPVGTSGTFPDCVSNNIADTCASLGYNCGTLNGALCGVCTSTQTCRNNICVANTGTVINNGTVITDGNNINDTSSDDTLLYIIVAGVTGLAGYLGYLYKKKKLK